MDNRVLNLVSNAFRAVDRVNEFVLAAANALVFSKDHVSTISKLQAIVATVLDDKIAEASAALKALKSVIKDEPEARFERARNAIEVLLRDLLPRVKADLQEQLPRAYLVLLSKGLTHHTLTIKHIFAGINQ